MAESNAKALAWLLTSVCDACADEMMAEMDEYDGPTEAPPPSPTASIIAFPVPTEPASGPRRARR